MAETIRIEVEPTRDDYEDAWYLLTRSTRVKDLWRPIRHTGIALMAIAFFLAAVDHSYWVVAVLLFALGGFQVVCAVRGLHGEVQRYWANYLRGMETATWEFREEGVTVTTSLSSLRYTWGAFSGFKVSNNLFVLLRPSNAFIVPKRCFADDAEREAFRRMLEARIPSKIRAFPVVPLSEKTEADARAGG